MAPTDATTTCNRYWTAYIVSNGTPVTLAMTDLRNDETEADAVKRVLARVEKYPFKIELLVADSGFFNERVIRRAREIAATVVHVPKKGDCMKEETQCTQVVYGDLSPVHRQRAGHGVPARGRCLLPERATNTARLSVTTWLAASPITPPNRSNESIGNDQVLRRPTG